jgi:polyisoprenoid-binding protein YceI
LVRPLINRQEFGVSWNDVMDQWGIVVSNIEEIKIDAEAILETAD